LSRFISSKCSDISEQNEVINSSSFAVASFDNLDKNQSYAKVVHGNNFFSKLSHAKDSSPVSLKSSKLKWENLLPLMGEGSPILSSGSFSDLIKAVLSTKSSNFLKNLSFVQLKF
jgi:hypothetical protein